MPFFEVSILTLLHKKAIIVDGVIYKVRGKGKLRHEHSHTKEMATAEITINLKEREYNKGIKSMALTATELIDLQ